MVLSFRKREREMLSKRVRKQSVGFCNSIPDPGKAIRVAPVMELEKNLILIC